MKFIFNLKKFIPLLFLSALVLSCNNDDDNTPDPDPTIVELAQANPDLSTLVDALLLANEDLVGLLSGGQFTVLAPTNAAFDAFLQDNGFANLEAVPVDLLTNVLKNHVLNGQVGSGVLLNAGAGYTNTNATNADGDILSLYYNTSSGVQFNGGATVTTPDVGASNGVVHVVDAVIGLPTVVTFVTADPNFSTLTAALTRQDLTFDYVTTLSIPNGTSPAPFTVFAPDNTAFGDLLTELQVATLDDIPEPTLKATLDMHAVAMANVRASDLQQGQTVGTLGGDITISLDAGPQVIDANDRVSNITATDIQALNGVIHEVDKVILPPL
ncbi:MAG: fasciclin domain-containing protein [Flavobacteriaceae bacterium]|nr:fasciclin domain-containing protein [Flavobacteriaceae bacterium]